MMAHSTILEQWSAKHEMWLADRHIKYGMLTFTFTYRNKSGRSTSDYLPTVSTES